MTFKNDFHAVEWSSKSLGASIEIAGGNKFCVKIDLSVDDDHCQPEYLLVGGSTEVTPPWLFNSDGFFDSFSSAVSALVKFRGVQSED